MNKKLKFNSRSTFLCFFCAFIQSRFIKEKGILSLFLSHTHKQNQDDDDDENDDEDEERMRNHDNKK